MPKTYGKRKHMTMRKTRRRRGGLFSVTTNNNMASKDNTPSMSKIKQQGKELADKNFKLGLQSAQKYANKLYDKNSKSGEKYANNLYDKHSKTVKDIYKKQKHSSPENYMASKVFEITGKSAMKVGNSMANEYKSKNTQPRVNISNKTTSYTPNFSSKNTALALERSQSGPLVSQAYNPTIASMPKP